MNHILADISMGIPVTSQCIFLNGRFVSEDTLERQRRISDATFGDAQWRPAWLATLSTGRAYWREEQVGRTAQARHGNAKTYRMDKRPRIVTGSRQYSDRGSILAKKRVPSLIPMRHLGQAYLQIVQ